MVCMGIRLTELSRSSLRLSLSSIASPICVDIEPEELPWAGIVAVVSLKRSPRSVSLYLGVFCTVVLDANKTLSRDESDDEGVSGSMLIRAVAVRLERNKQVTSAMFSTVLFVSRPWTDLQRIKPLYRVRLFLKSAHLTIASHNTSIQL